LQIIRVLADSVEVQLEHSKCTVIHIIPGLFVLRERGLPRWLPPAQREHWLEHWRWFCTDGFAHHGLSMVRLARRC
jgi:hypothetical protein